MRRALLAFLLLAPAAFGQSGDTSGFDSLLTEARRSQAGGDYRGAAASYERAAAIHPEIAELWANVGLMRHESGDFRGAAAAFRTALKLKPSLSVPNLFLGIDLMELGDTRAAIPYLLAANKLDGRDVQAMLALGRGYHMLRDAERSEQWYQRAADAAPQNGQAWYGLGLAWFDMAETAAATLAKSHHESTYYAGLRADTLAEQGRIALAIRSYKTLLESNGAPRCSHAEYGFALMRFGNREEAAREFRTDEQACPAARIGLARLEWDAGSTERALEMLAGFAKSEPQAFNTSLPHFWSGLDANQMDELLTRLKRSSAPVASTVAAAITSPSAVDNEQRQNVAVGRLGESELQRVAADAFFSGDLRSADLASKRLITDFPAHAAGWYWAVRVRQALGVRALARAGQVEPDSIRMHALLGDIYIRRQMFADAEQQFSAILAASPGNMAGLSGLASALYGDGKLEDARHAAQQALDRSPNDPDVTLLMGEILVALREYTAAEPYLKASLTFRTELAPHVHALLGRVCARTGRTKEAVAELKQGLASDEDGSIYYQLGRAYQDLGNQAAAKVALEKSKQLRANRHAWNDDAPTADR